MIKLLGRIPRSATVALSGGIDSMVLLDFLSRNHTINAAFFHHGTENSAIAHQFLISECERRNIVLNVGHISNNQIRGKSPEEHWREERYKFLSQFETVVTAHTLDDVAETWIWSSLHGTSSLIPYERNNVIRPFLLTRKSELVKWASNNDVRWIEDQSNNDVKYTRNYIRQHLMPHAIKVNPGLHTMLKKKLEERHKKYVDTLNKSYIMITSQQLEVVE